MNGSNWDFTETVREMCEQANDGALKNEMIALITADFTTHVAHCTYHYTLDSIQLTREHIAKHFPTVETYILGIDIKALQTG